MLDHIQRSRLKVTITAMVIILLFTLFPMYVILQASFESIYELAAAWGAFLGGVSAIAGIAGYYVNKDTQRPSYVHNTNIDIDNPQYEDGTDPEYIPL